MRTCKNVYMDERDKLIPEAIRRTEAICGRKLDKVPSEYAELFLQQMDILANETWLLSRRRLPVLNETVRLFLAENNILPTRAGKIVINCAAKNVGSVDFVSF